VLSGTDLDRSGAVTLPGRRGWDMSKKPPEPTATNVMKVNLWLRVENNNKFTRRKKKVRQGTGG
jgi:hypothetical protein